MIDQFPNQPEFQIIVTGGSVEENNQLTTAVYHALSMCGFSALNIDAQNSLTPGYQHSGDVLNALQALNPSLFESQMRVAGLCEADMMQQASYQQPTTGGFGINW